MVLQQLQQFLLVCLVHKVGGAISGVSIDWLGVWIEANIAFFNARQYVPRPNSFVALAFTLDDSVPVACTSTALPRWKV